jgi:hypothetical protein
MIRAWLFQVRERRQRFNGVRNETVPVISVRISNPDRLPVGIHGRDTTVTPIGFTEFVTDDSFTRLRRFRVLALGWYGD